MHTHDVRLVRALVTKRYTSWSRGEHVREWAALRQLHRYAPGLAPRPLTARLDDQPPLVTMSRLTGVPLAGRPDPRQRAALGDALATLWRVPPGELVEVGPWMDDLDFAAKLTAGPRPEDGIGAAAYDAASDWWAGPDPALLRQPPASTVLGHRDPNALNYLWDGRRVRVVDFEDAAVSDIATELALMLEHLSWRGVDLSDLVARFDVDATRLLAARRVWAMFWLRLLLPGGPAAVRNPPGTTDLQAARLLRLLDD